MGFIRLLLALSVLLEHSGPLFGLRFVGGEIAVQCFFVISGFYMAFILNEKYIGENNSWKLFISNRLLRLMPLYWFIIILILFKSMLLYFFTAGQTASHLQPYVQYGPDLNITTWLILIASNILIIGQDILMFTGLDLSSGSLYFTSAFNTSHPAIFGLMLIPPAWSISTELFFYALAPFLLRKSSFMLLLFFLASILLRIILYSNGKDFDPWTYRFFPTELALFLAGCFGYRFYKHLQSTNTDVSFSRYIYFFMLLLILFYSLFSFEYQRLVFTCLFILATPFIFLFSKESRSDRITGELSYPIYLVHMLISSMIAYLPFTDWLGKGLMLTLLCILFAWIYNSVIGNRIERMRQKRVA